MNLFLFYRRGENISSDDVRNWGLRWEEAILAEKTPTPSPSATPDHTHNQFPSPWDKNFSPQEPVEAWILGTPAEQNVKSKCSLLSFPYILIFLEKDQILREVLFNKFLDDFLFDPGIQDVGYQAGITQDIAGPTSPLSK